MTVCFWICVLTTILCVYMIFRPLSHSESPVDNWIGDIVALYIRLLWLLPICIAWFAFGIGCMIYGLPWK